MNCQIHFLSGLSTASSLQGAWFTHAPTSATQLEHEAAWCSTFSCLKTSQTGDSAGFQLVRYLRYRDTSYRRNTLLTRLLKNPGQSTTGFALHGAHQVDAVPEFISTLYST
ncbi:hypothetical protein CSKR_103201 [Clonorchis sinensis]|uniref:Uncharacterized protein n=1 Tax=Clonorchis sinensis TaxID=79923 RepID=A0A419PND1_CLOSI|nr:hypothetical protein CSKR_103201 [Clonorchis sinensis]